MHIGKVGLLKFESIRLLMLPSGTYATVNLAYTLSRSNGVFTYQQVACKMLKVTSEMENTKLMREVELLKGLDHVRRHPFVGLKSDINCALYS